MRPRAITVLRALSWVGFALAAWSLNLRWGDDPALGNGPPTQWERQVVGAALIAFMAALTLSVAGRGDKPPGWVARGLALAGGAGAVAIALVLRANARSDGKEQLLAGGGWTWLVVGAGLVLLAASAAFALPRPAPAAAASSGRRRRRKS